LARNFVNKKKRTLTDYVGAIRRRAISSFLALKQNHGGRTVRGDSEVETVVTWWLVTGDTYR